MVDDDGAYRRVLRDAQGSNLLEVRQSAEDALTVRIGGAQPERWHATAAAMLGAGTDVADWYERVAPYPWLAELAEQLRGLRPPRYPTLWEALAHAIVFQQISIHAAAAIMRRTVERLSEPHEADGKRFYPFFTPADVLYASDEVLRGAGLSANKVEHLRSAAAAIEDGDLNEAALAQLSSEEAALKLQAVRGIGPWSASVVLLRGLGRLDVFPLKDSGVARALRDLSGDPGLDAGALLQALGPVRGFLYYHLLLGRMRNLAPGPSDSGSA